MRTILVAAIPACLLLAACESDPSQTAVNISAPASGGSSEMVYVRADGKRLSSDPALAQQLELDKTVCRGDAERVGLVARNEIETQKPNFAVSLINAGIKESKVSDVMKGCMAQHGYIYMTVAEAEARADAMAVAGSKKKKRRA